MQNNPTTQPLSVGIAVNPRHARALFEGPSRAQVKKMRATRLEKLAAAKAALEAGHDERAFDLDCAAFDIECTLRQYGYEVA